MAASPFGLPGGRFWTLFGGRPLGLPVGSLVVDKKINLKILLLSTLKSSLVIKKRDPCVKDKESPLEGLR